MLTLLFVILFIALTWTLAYHHAVLSVWTFSYFLYLSVMTESGHFSSISLSLLWIVFSVGLLPLNCYPLRRWLISRHLLAFFQKVMPRMSSTEKEALEAGTVGFEGELFGGKPNWKACLQLPSPKLSVEEKSFLENEVEVLCDQINDWELTHVHTTLPDHLWQYLKEKGFFGMIIPKSYGGKGFSAYAHACVLMKVYGRSLGVATTISVPNSLGPAELLLQYGTDAQKSYYLPRLAKGEEIPCFALTGPNAGSDAASIPDTGIVTRALFDGVETLGIRLNWNKRYITLAPIATLLGLAFKLYDPDHLLGDKTDIGISCALIPTNLPGISIGRRHFPLNTSFLNGPTQGKDVFIPMDYLIGGQSMAGCGWRMLMECLSVGRAISLPSSAIGGMQSGAYATSAYARIRRQFQLPIGYFEGIEEPMARIAGFTYIGNAAIKMTLGLIDAGAEPAVASAILKYHCTELGRQVVNDCMDIQGGKGICLGPNNLVGRHYQGMPIGITVEGANILTRSLIIFGQGAIRCHPFVIEELHAAEEHDLVRFDKAIFRHVGHMIANAFRAFFIALTGARVVKVPASPVSRYFQILTRYSVAFAFVSEVSMLVLGANLKRREKISARLGDALSMMYLASGVIKQFHDDNTPEEDLPLVKWATRYCLYQTQEALFGVLKNFPNRIVAMLLHVVIFPFGKHLSTPDDALGASVARMMVGDNETRNRLTALVHTHHEANNPIARVKAAFHATLETEALEKRMLEGLANREIKRQLTYPQTVEKAFQSQIITREEADVLLNAEKLRQIVIAVDDFAPADLSREQLTPSVMQSITASTAPIGQPVRKHSAPKK